MTRYNLRMTFRLLVGTSEEREGIIAGCLEATFELTVKTRAEHSLAEVARTCVEASCRG